MSRFNQTAVDHSKTINLAGGEAFRISPEMELYTRVCTSVLSDSYYQSASEDLNRIIELIGQCSHNFVAQLAVYARETMYLRTIPIVLTVELAKIHSGDSLISNLTERVIKRADEITEMLAYYQVSNQRNGVKKLHKLSNQLKKGIARAFNKFDEYQFSKYNRSKEVKLKDALTLTHPKPKDGEQDEIFKKIKEDSLEVPYTWEVRLSEAGQKGESKKDIWEELIESKKVGYMAILRNLRNIIQADVSNKHIEMVADYLSNENAVLNSKQLPFRFLSAYRILSGGVVRSTWYSTGTYSVDNDLLANPKNAVIRDALEKAIQISVKNIPMFDNESVLIASDVSGSMQMSVSDRSVIELFDIGVVLSMLANHKCRYTTTGIFGDIFKVYNFPSDSILENASSIRKINGEVGYSTHGYKVLEYANRTPNKYDRVMMFTDTQMYGDSIQREWNKFKRKNPDAKLYIFDLRGSSSAPLRIERDDVYLISGWNESIFKILNAIENGNKALDEIKNILI